MESRWVPRFREVELRIGNRDESEKGLVSFSDNKLVGFYPDANDELEVLFTFPPTYGRFLTLQILRQGHLELNELFVFSS